MLKIISYKNESHIIIDSFKDDMYYKEIGADSYIVETVKSCYKLAFNTKLEPSFLLNYKSDLKERDFMQYKFFRLKQLGCIKRVQQKLYITMPCSVVF